MTKLSSNMDTINSLNGSITGALSSKRAKIRKLTESHLLLKKLQVHASYQTAGQCLPSLSHCPYPQNTYPVPMLRHRRPATPYCRQAFAPPHIFLLLLLLPPHAPSLSRVRDQLTTPCALVLAVLRRPLKPDPSPASALSSCSSCQQGCTSASSSRPTARQSNTTPEPRTSSSSTRSSTASRAFTTTARILWRRDDKSVLPLSLLSLVPRLPCHAARSK